MQTPEPSNNDHFSREDLFTFLREHISGMEGDIHVERIGGGQSNPTYFITTASRQLVLRKRPAGYAGTTQHDILREYTVMQALGATGLAVPATVLYQAGSDLIGTDFYVMERVPSRQFFDARLPGISAADRRSLYRDAARQLALMHALDWQALGLHHYARPGNFLERQISRWEKVFAGCADEPVARHIATHLRQSMPAPGAPALIHGDYKFSNVLIHPTRPEIAAILDWELCTIGDPLTDLAHTCVAIWGTTAAEYGGLLGATAAADGLPTQAEFLEDYYAHCGGGPRLTHFYLILAYFRNAGIFYGIRQRAAAGTASAASAASVGEVYHAYLQRARDLL